MILSLLVSTSALLAPSPSEFALDDMVKNARAANLFAAEGNTISSPANVLMVTIMMAQAVDAGSRTQILQSLHPQMTMADGRVFFQQLAKGLDPETTRLARAVWTVSGATPAAEQGIEEEYGAEVGKIPSQAEADDWANRNTAGMVRQFPIQVRGQNVVIASALAYINAWRGGEWRKKDLSFQFEDGVREIAGFEASGPELKVGEVSAFSFFYQNGERLVLLFNENGSTPESVAKWRTGEWQRVLEDSGQGLAFVTLPSFEYRAQTDFMGAWAQRSRPSLATFPGLTSGPQAISFQEGAFIRVDEKGTKAASIVSAAGGGGMLLDPRRITIDRPFVFAIVRHGYPLPLFVGTVNSPSITP